VLVGRDGRVEDGGGEAFVLRQQIVGELVEVADAADARRPGNYLVRALEQLTEQADVLASPWAKR